MSREIGRERGDGETIIEIQRLELSTLAPGSQLFIHLDDKSVFHAFLVDPETGKAVLRPWVGGGQRNAGYRDAMSIVGTRPMVAGTITATEPTGDQDVQWGGITFGDELVLKNDEGAGTTLFTGHAVTAAEAGQPVE